MHGPRRLCLGAYQLGAARANRLCCRNALGAAQDKEAMGRIITSLLLVVSVHCNIAVAGGDLPAQSSEAEKHLQHIEARLDSAMKLLEQAKAQVEALMTELVELRVQIYGRQAAVPDSAARTAAATGPGSPGVKTDFAESILGTDLGGDERENKVGQRPEVFIQARYSAWPLEGATIEDIDSNFTLSRIETRWSGRVGERLGLGLEIQYHPAPDGAPEELVNDAFIEYYVNRHATLKIGQFIKPFGFDIQQSSSARESPERAIFAGYFFPGQRDRGLMLFGDLDFLNIPALRSVQYFAGIFNGNRFFVDSNRQLNYIFRLRKRFEAVGLAAGVSAQLGAQLLPPGIRGNNNENIFGIDIQYVRGRFGLRGEFVAGNMPSTLLGLPPEFAPAFRPGRRSAGGAILAIYQVAERDKVYARYDQFNGDPVSGLNVRAFNFGYTRSVGERLRVGLDYQFKNRLSFNDDAVNTSFQLTWGLLF